MRSNCHFTEKYQGAASICNLRYAISHEMAIFVRNGSKYDFHLIIMDIDKEFDSSTFHCLKKNTERLY